MARKIVCESCFRQTQKNAAQYSEVWETIKGTPINDISCDDCGTPLQGATSDSKCVSCGQKVKGNPMGDICYAGVLLDSKSHPQYERQKPSKWASAYINELITCINCQKETPTVACIHCGHNNDADHICDFGGGPNGDLCKIKGCGKSCI